MVDGVASLVTMWCETVTYLNVDSRQQALQALICRVYPGEQRGLPLLFDLNLASAALSYTLGETQQCQK